MSPVSPSLQVDSLPAEPLEKPIPILPKVPGASQLHACMLTVLLLLDIIV